MTAAERVFIKEYKAYSNDFGWDIDSTRYFLELLLKVPMFRVISFDDDVGNETGLSIKDFSPGITKTEVHDIFRHGRVVQVLLSWWLMYWCGDEILMNNFIVQYTIP